MDSTPLPPTATRLESVVVMALVVISAAALGLLLTGDVALACVVAVGAVNVAGMLSALKGRLLVAGLLAAAAAATLIVGTVA